MAQATSQHGGAAQTQGLSNIDYGRMLQQLQSLHDSNSVPGEHRQALNEALLVLNSSAIEQAFQRQIQSQGGLQSQSMSAATGQGAPLGTNTGRGGQTGRTGSGIPAQSSNE